MIDFADRSLFQSEAYKLTAVDPEADAPRVTPWTQDLSVARVFLGDDPIRPLPAFEIKKKLEEWAKQMDDSSSIYIFSVRGRFSNDLLGMIVLSPYWAMGSCRVDVLLDPAAELNQIEIVHMALNFAFSEMNMFRVWTWVPSLSTDRLAVLESAGFRVQVRLREAAYQDGQRADMLMLGLYSEDWNAPALYINPDDAQEELS